MGEHLRRLRGGYAEGGRDEVKATRNQPIPVTPPTTIDLLGMTEAEADALLCIMRKIGGNPDKSSRGVADRVTEALRAVGVKGLPATAAEGNIYFR